MADNNWSVLDMGEKRFAATNHRYAIECETGTRLVAMVEGMGESYRRRALMIAAAPELLEACEQALEAFDRAPTSFSRDNASAIQRLRDAIGKATSA